MLSFTPSAPQARAIADISDWYQNRRHLQQVFRLFGYAGSGKSTITAHAIEAMGLSVEPDEGRWIGRVLFAAFTGKAALVMTRKGTPASTIHSLIYRVSEATPEEIERVERDLAALRTRYATLGRPYRIERFTLPALTSTEATQMEAMAMAVGTTGQVFAARSDAALGGGIFGAFTEPPTVARPYPQIWTSDLQIEEDA